MPIKLVQKNIHFTDKLAAQLSYLTEVPTMNTYIHCALIFEHIRIFLESTHVKRKRRSRIGHIIKKKLTFNIQGSRARS